MQVLLFMFIISNFQTLESIKNEKNTIKKNETADCFYLNIPNDI